MKQFSIQTVYTRNFRLKTFSINYRVEAISYLQPDCKLVLYLPITAEQSAELNFGPGSHGFELEKKPENA